MINKASQEDRARSCQGIEELLGICCRLSYDRVVVDPRSRGGAKSLDDHMKSQSIGGYVFPMFQMLDAKIATALKRIISNQYFRRSINVE